MSDQEIEPAGEDDGVLEPADSLDGRDLRDDVLDTGVDAGERYRGVNRFGTTAEEESRGESLDQLLAEEEPELQDDDAPWSDEDEPRHDDRTTPRRGRRGRARGPPGGGRPRGGRTRPGGPRRRHRGPRPLRRGGRGPGDGGAAV